MKKIFSRVKAIAVSAVVLASGLYVMPGFSADDKISADGVELNYAKALQYSMYFYDANMCGTEVGEKSQYTWRDDCHTYDAKLVLDSENTNMTDSFIAANKDVLDPDGDGCVDVAGGFHDAGDHVKFGMPEGYSGATLGWDYYEFRDEYDKTGQSEHAETLIRYFNDYFMKCTYLDDDGKAVAFCYQVGDGDIDHQYWNAPEIDEMPRKGWFATDELISTDVLSISSASLAINYLNFRDSDPEYAQKSLKYAEALFEFADRAEKKAVNKDGGKGYYTSGKWEDDYCFASIWLYMCTKEKKYLDNVLSNVDYYAPSCWTYCWNDVWAGVMTVLAEADDMYGTKTTNSVGKESTEFVDEFVKMQNKSPYEDINWWSQIEKTFDNWMNGTTPKTSPAGYAFLQVWGSARYNTATQFLAMVYDKHHGDKTSKYGEWAKSQMDYLLGENPLNRCYVVGYSDISAKYPHHRAASGLSVCEDPGEQRYVLYGALVGGPDLDDNHIDVTSDWIYNEVTIDYNAAFVGACAGHYHFFGDSSMEITPDFPPEPKEIGDGPDDPSEITPTSKYWVDAFCVDVAQSDGPKATEVTFYVRSTASKPEKNISVRYYFDASGMSSVDEDKMELRKLYDQAEIEADHAATAPVLRKYKDNIYYVEVSWEDYAIANSNKKYQFALGTYAWGNSWNPDDDWSHTDLKQVEDSFKGTVEKSEYICLYDGDGNLIGGTEPDGTVPAVTTQATATATEKPATTTTTAAKTTTTTTEKPVTTTQAKVTTVTGDIDIIPVTTTQLAGHPVQSEPVSREYGDINNDGVVEMTDLTILSQLLIGDIKLDNVSLKYCDVNGDTDVNLADMSHFKQYILKEKVILGPQK
ncbi:MAG: glycoside hydrolase family 9 protein [Oscillospiraceae bacterium]|nr:glycoside hydrolase family 9 protein [Oscillospiraceae bacterium]